MRKLFTRVTTVSTVLVLVAWAPAALADVLPTPVVVVEEDVYDIVSPDNGAGPLWCYGCTQIVRHGDDVVVSQMETGEGIPKLCNTRWRLLQREEDGWKRFAEAEGFRQREPCPVGVTQDHGLFLYVNDSLKPPGAEYLDCEPHLLRFALKDKAAAPVKVSPDWGAQPYFTDHSYRGFGVDGPRNALLMLNIDAKTSIQHWCHLTSDGKTVGNGEISFPIRACYPQVALQDGAAHVMAIGDIVEPVEAWRQYKFEQTGQKWDYVFRVLYYTWTPDISNQGFAEPIEIANRDATAGAISNQDLWVGPDGSAYVMYTERVVQNAMMRDKFFPGESIDTSLHLAVVKAGVIAERRELVAGGEGVQAGYARFHETPDGKLYAVAYIANSDPGDYLLQVYPKSDVAAPVKIPLATPFGAFCLAGVRGGSTPSNMIDIFGHSTGGGTLSYARVDLK